MTLTASLGTVTRNDNGTWSWSYTPADGPAPTTVTITATDSGGLTSSTTFSLTVNNVAPTIAITGAARVNEGAPYTLTLGDVTDPGSDTVSEYVVHWGDGTSDRYTSAGDRTHVYADGGTYSITVDLVDEDGTHADRANPLSVVVNAAPTDITLSNSSVAENQSAGTTVGTLSTTDPDSGDPFTYKLVSGEGDHASFSMVDGVLKTAAVLDFEAQSSYSIRVQATDADGLSTEKVLTVGALDVNDPLVLGGTRARQRVKDNRTIRPFASMTVADEDSPAQVLTVTVQQSRPRHGRFTAASRSASGFSSVGRGQFSFQGTAAQAEAALRALVFNPTDDRAPAGAKVRTTFAVEVSDGLATVRDDSTSVVATSVNDRPAGMAQTYSVASNWTLYVPAWQGLLAGASDPEGDRLQAVLVSGPAAGQLHLAPDGSFLYVPPPGIARTVTFQYRVSDGHGGYSDPLTATLEVLAPTLPTVIR